ncbi:MAG: DNA polymerase III subunit delta [Lachnospiraceae bacterium]|nr:DNA polymerase III subunit delta [Lachnospiraceae bacterium]
MKRINEDIKTGNFSRIYLLTGTEDYLRNQYQKRLQTALLGDGDKMNLSVFEGKDISLKQVVELAETLPFFADRRVIVIENSGLLKSGGDMLADYLKEPASATYFVFHEKEIDKRSRLYKIIRDNGHIGEFNEQDETTLTKWIRNIVKQERMEIEGPAVALILYKTGTNMELIRKEVEKCICYCLNKGKITTADVETICTKQITNRIFEMINHIAAGRQEAALKIYYDLLSLKEPPMKILSLISRQFHLLLQTKLLREKGYDKRIISEKIGVAPFIAGKYMEQAARFQKQVLRNALEDCVKAEEDVKTGKMADVMSVELLMIKCSSAR